VLPLGGPNVTGANVPLEYAALLEEDPLAGAGGITICVIPRSTRPDTQLNRSAILKTTNGYMARTVIKSVKRVNRISLPQFSKLLAERWLWLWYSPRSFDNEPDPGVVEDRLVQVPLSCMQQQDHHYRLEVLRDHHLGHHLLQRRLP